MNWVSLLDIPILFLSGYVINHKNDYYRLLQEVRVKGDWEEWILFILKGVEVTARNTINQINQINSALEQTIGEVREKHLVSILKSW